MADLSEREIDSLANAFEIKMRDLLEAHAKEMKKASKDARDATVEALTGYTWDNRHRVRRAIEWAMKQRDSHTKRQAMFWGAIIVLGVGHLWESIIGVFHG